jgi:hypothetical protein
MGIPDALPNQGLMGLVLSGAQEAITGVSRGFAGRT